MPETRKEVKTYKVEYTCDVCGEGNMERNGKIILNILTNKPPSFPHKCTLCRTERNFENTYPHQLLKNIE